MRIPGLLEITFGTQRIPVEVRQDRFRTLRISVRPEGVRVRAPRGASAEAILAHVQAKAAWIARHLERLRARPPARTLEYVHGEVHPFLGRGYPLDLRPGAPGGVRLGPDSLEITTRTADPDRVRRLLNAWYREQAREVFTKVIRGLLPRADALGLPRPTRLTVRAMTSRWGSCARSGSISLNLHLIKAPLCCVEFVAAHELCHLLRHGHDKRFYALLQSLIPDWKERRERLSGANLL